MCINGRAFINDSAVGIFMQLRRIVYLLGILVGTINTAWAVDELAQANNPLANMRALNFQNYYYPDISGFNQTGDTFWIRYAQPVNKFLVRASMPFTSYPVTQSIKKTGSSDFNIFAAYTMDTGNSAVSAGIGPLLVAPTASPTSLGAGKWQGGLAAVYFNANSAKFQYGGLLTYQVDFAGQKDRPHTSIMALQPFAFLQVSHGVYFRAAPIMLFNFVSNTRVVPLSLGIGKVIKSGKTVYNLFVEPQFSVSYNGPGQPLTQIYAGLNMQFYE